MTVNELRAWANKRVQEDMANRRKPVKLNSQFLGKFDSSTSDLIYKVFKRGGRVTCDCPGFSYRGNCRHIREFL